MLDHGEYTTAKPERVLGITTSLPAIGRRHVASRTSSLTLFLACPSLPTGVILYGDPRKACTQGAQLLADSPSDQCTIWLMIFWFACAGRDIKHSKQSQPGSLISLGLDIVPKRCL